MLEHVHVFVCQCRHKCLHAKGDTFAASSAARHHCELSDADKRWRPRTSPVAIYTAWTGQTTVNKKSADSPYNPYKWHGPQTPLKMFQKNSPPKFHDKAVQSNILWLNLNKIGEISIYNQHMNKVTSHFTFMRQAQNVDTHALKQPRLSQNIFPVCFSFVLVIASDKHLEL